MRFRHFVQTCAATAALAVTGAASAHDHQPGADYTGAPAPAVVSVAPGGPGTMPDGPDTRPDWQGDAPRGPHASMEPGRREIWLAECRRRSSYRDDGIGGAVVGGIFGGIAGNRIAGRHHRTTGTLAGAAVGAVAGAAIDKAEDRGRIRDECETYLDDYYAYYEQANRGYGSGYPAYASSGCCQPAVMVPAYGAPRTQPECTETVEYVYEDVPVRRAIRHIPSKRVKVVPDKRVKIN